MRTRYRKDDLILFGQTNGGKTAKQLAEDRKALEREVRMAVREGRFWYMVWQDIKARFNFNRWFPS